MNVETKPAYLKASTVRQGLISFHTDQVELLRDNLREQRDLAARRASELGETIDAKWFETYDRTIGAARWEDGSVSAVWRDRLAFHEAALGFLLDG